MKTNFVLIDYENVQPASIPRLPKDHFRISFFLGSSQGKLAMKLTAKFRASEPAVDIVQIEGDGRNNLDFHLCYRLGKLAAENPGAFFHIITKDKGFDSLIKYLKRHKVLCQRSTSVDDIPLIKAASCTSISDRTNLVIDYLRGRGAAAPRSLKTLKGTIRSRFPTALQESEVDALIDRMRGRKVLKLDGNKVTYLWS